MRTLALLALLAMLLAGCGATPPLADSTGSTSQTTSTAGTTTSAPTSSTAPPSHACDGVTKAGLTLSDPSHTAVALATAKGCIAAELYDDRAPITVANFKTYADEAFYDGTLFHRIIQTFMIQGGGMGMDGQFKQSTHPPIKNEAKASGLKNLAYTLAMARQNEPDTATDQFFVNTVDNPGLDPGGYSPDGYAVFGIVVQGRDVVDAIAAIPVTMYNARGANPHCQPEGQPSCPTEDQVVATIRVLA